MQGDLLQTVMELFHAIKNKDEASRLSLLYDPNFDEFAGMEPYILGIAKIERDDSRVQAVTDEFALAEEAEDVSIVKISIKTLDAQKSRHILISTLYIVTEE